MLPFLSEGHPEDDDGGDIDADESVLGHPEDEDGTNGAEKNVDCEYEGEV